MNAVLSPESQIDDGDLLYLHADHVKVIRIRLLMQALGIFGGVVALTLIFNPPGGLAAIFFGFLLPAIYVIIFPRSRYQRSRYSIGTDRLRIVGGFLFMRDTIVPFSRVQHIDVEQGPVQRRYGLATLQVHTAGDHNSTIYVPGLLYETALEMRDAIRANIQAGAR